MKLTKMLKKLMVLAIVAVSAVALVGCKPDNPVEDTKEYTYNTYTALSPSNWNELTYQDNNDTQIMSYIGSSFFQYDFKYDANGEIIDGEFEMQFGAATALVDVSKDYIGEKYNITEGETGRAYKITLRQDLKWDDGTAIKAEDFVYTMQEQLNPLFQNYRADSFYNGATVIHNAQAYAKQGQSGLFSANSAYSTYSADMDDKLIFTIGNAVLQNDAPVTSYLSQWLTSQLGTVYDTAGATQILNANFFGTDPLDAEVLTEMEGKTFAEIKANTTYKAQWDKLIGWWQTEPNEELHFFVAEYTYPEVAWAEVGMFVDPADEYSFILVLEKSLPLLKEDGSLSYQAAYNMSSLPLVKKDLYEACKQEPIAGSELWTTTYNTSKETCASWGPYKLESFQEGKEYVLVRNENWYGYSDSKYEGQYQTTKVVCETIAEWNTAWLKFQKGEIDGIGIDVTIADEYKNSDRAYFTPDDFVASLQLQSSEEGLKKREVPGEDKEILANVKFRKALSLAINREDFAAKTTTSSLKGFGLFNSMHYYDVENGGVYRNTDDAKKVLCEVYGVEYTDATLDEAVNSITGYDLIQARKLVDEAVEEQIAAGKMTATDVVRLTGGSGAINETVTRRFNYIFNAWTELVKGTKLEGKLVFDEVKDFQSQWANDFRGGGYDVCMGGWSGAAWDPGYFLLAYLSPDYMYSTAWDTSSQQMTFTMKGVGENGADITDTMSLMDWYNALNGAHAKYDFSANALEQSQRLQLIAALEKEVLLMYYSVPLYNSFGASLISHKVDYVTYTYNTFMGYGGVRYMTYNYTDKEWADFLAADSDGILEYK